MRTRTRGSGGGAGPTDSSNSVTRPEPTGASGQRAGEPVARARQRVQHGGEPPTALLVLTDHRLEPIDARHTVPVACGGPLDDLDGIHSDDGRTRSRQETWAEGPVVDARSG